MTWIKGRGEHLPPGTEGWIAYKTLNGYGVSFDRRWENGWGLREALSTDGFEVAFHDDGDPDMYLKMDSMLALFGRPAITHYWVVERPDPPTDEDGDA